MIGATSGALTFDAAPSFEDPQDQDAGNTRVEGGRRGWRLVRAPMLRVCRLAAAFLLAAAAVLPVAPVAAQDLAPAAPTGFAVAPGSIKAKLSWDDPPAGITRTRCVSGPAPPRFPLAADPRQRFRRRQRERLHPVRLDRRYGL